MSVEDLFATVVCLKCAHLISYFHVFQLILLWLVICLSKIVTTVNFQCCKNCFIITSILTMNTQSAAKRQNLTRFYKCNKVFGDALHAHQFSQVHHQLFSSLHSMAELNKISGVQGKKGDALHAHLIFSHAPSHFR